MARLISQNTNPKGDSEEQETGPKCPLCGRRLILGIYKKLITEGVGSSVFCKTPDCPAIASVELKEKGQYTVNF